MGHHSTIIDSICPVYHAGETALLTSCRGPISLDITPVLTPLPEKLTFLQGNTM